MVFGSTLPLFALNAMMAGDDGLDKARRVLSKWIRMLDICVRRRSRGDRCDTTWQTNCSTRSRAALPIALSMVEASCDHRRDLDYDCIAK